MWKYYEKKFKKKYINRENIGANFKKMRTFIVI